MMIALHQVHEFDQKSATSCSIAMTTTSERIGSTAAHLSEYLARMCCRSWALSEEKRKIPKTDSPETEFSTHKNVHNNQRGVISYFLNTEARSCPLGTGIKKL
jgi:hypothetical protein